MAFLTFHFSLFTLSSCERIRDARADCGVWLRFAFDHNMEYTDSFAQQAARVDVYIYDAEGKFVSSRHAAQSELVDGRRMFVGDLAMGDYKILSVANFDPEHFRLTASTIEGAEMSLIHDGVVECRFERHLFVAPPVDVRYDSKKTSYTVPMIRQTNNFHVTLQTLAPRRTRAAAPVHTVSIVAPEAGCYNHLNAPTDRRQTTYRPHTLSCDDPRLTSAKLNTMRLLEDERDYRISVRGVADDKELWGTDLLPLLSATKPAKRPDGTDLPCSEYYDREGEWNIVIVHRAAAPGDGFTALRIVVNGWVVWQNPIEL